MLPKDAAHLVVEDAKCSTGCWPAQAVAEGLSIVVRVLARLALQRQQIHCCSAVRPRLQAGGIPFEAWLQGLDTLANRVDRAAINLQHMSGERSRNAAQAGGRLSLTS